MTKVVQVRLADICTINPRLPRDHGLTDETTVSFVPMAAVDETFGEIAVHAERVFREVKKGYTHFRNNDVLFAKITPCMQNGKAAIARELRNGIGFGSTEFHVLRHGNSVLPEWLFYFIRQDSFREQAKRSFTGTAGQQRVPALFLEKASIPLPPLAEQRRILDLLSRAEGIVRLRRAAQRKAAELIPAIFLDLFGDPASNPKHWPAAPLGDLLDACDYGTSKKASPDGAGVTVLRMGNVTYEGNLELADLKRVELDSSELNRQRLAPGDLLFNRTNSKELVGKTGLWDGRMEAVAASYFIRCRVDQTRVKPVYVWAVMNSGYMKRRLFETARGAIGQANINSRELKSLEMPLPPLDLQCAFAAKVSAAQGIAKLQAASAVAAEATFDALLHRAFADA